MKLAVYASISILVLFGTIMHTFIIHEHFYPTLVALSQEKLLLAVIYNFLFMLLITLMQALITLFVGSLAPIEMEQLVENGRGMVADTLLFLVFFSPTVNGRELSTLQLVQFIGVILVLKIYHSVAQIRTSRMFEIGLPTNTVILRVGSLLILLSSIDIGMLTYIAGLLEKTSTFYTWILFDFINISIGSVSTLIKFVLNMVDVKWSAQGWPSKSVYIFYTELVSDILQMTSYILFMGIFFYQNPSRLPIYAIADVLQVARQLAGRLKSFQRYREITSNMEARFPNATEEEMQAAESCIICRDSLTQGCKVLQCGHIFHTECLKNWAVVQQICPTCRAELVPRKISTTGKAETRQVTAALPHVETQPEQIRTVVPEHMSSPVVSSDSQPCEPRSDTVSITDLLEAIKHARGMVDYYHEQSRFWAGEVRAIQEQSLPPKEPEALKDVLEKLQRQVSASKTPSPPLSKAPSETELGRSDKDWDDIRRARQQRYEHDIRQRKEA